MSEKKLITLLLLFYFSISIGQQKDTIYGKVKKIREKVIFLTEKENPKLFAVDGDYGHSGFMGPESTISRFRSIWFSTQFCYFINYERHFNENGLLIEDIWYDKEDSIHRYYRFEYDNKNRIIIKIDSINEVVYTDTHYYKRDIHETIISQNSKFNFFNYKYKKYDQEGNLIRLKSIDEYGTMDEYIFNYNNNGKLLYRIYKNPNSWKQEKPGTWSYGVQDSIGNIYKDIVNKYDESNKLIQSQRFDLYEDEENHKDPKLVETTNYQYQKNNLVLTKHMSKYMKPQPTYVHYVYDEKNRLIKKYCCSEKESNAIRIEKYSYENDEIKFLDYSEISYPSKEMKTHRISFVYKYDDRGNWNEIVKKVDGVQLYKWIRQIEYFN
ncbi:MAG: hypothetical protein NXH73_06425 [Flavobacteriaceae bacterium]|nr:hypothetical protein [Flavobacteriaceae bacterium]